MSDTPLLVPDSLCARLIEGCADDWEAYVSHPFVKGLGDGTLPEAAFRHYLAQDYLFLIHFSRAYGLAVYKSETLEDMRAAAATLSALIDGEMKLHVSYCAGWGLDEAAMASVPEDPACMAYTRFVLERGLAGDILDLQVALAPCVVGYGVIGEALAASPETKWDGNPYRDWIEMYAGEEYREVATGAIVQLDRLMESRGGPNRLDKLQETFRSATVLEAAFWQMGLDAAERAT